MRFTLIDQVSEQSDERIVAVKNVTSAEEYLGDHFPGFAVLPGVMMLETLAQAGRLLVEGEARANGLLPLVIGEVRNVRYGNMVRPGEALVVEVTRRGADDEGFDLQGVGKVNGQVAVQGRFRLEAIPAATAVAAGDG